MVGKTLVKVTGMTGLALLLGVLAVLSAFSPWNGWILLICLLMLLWFWSYWSPQAASWTLLLLLCIWQLPHLLAQGCELHIIGSCSLAARLWQPTDGVLWLCVQALLCWLLAKRPLLRQIALLAVCGTLSLLISGETVSGGIAAGGLWLLACWTRGRQADRRSGWTGVALHLLLATLILAFHWVQQAPFQSALWPLQLLWPGFLARASQELLREMRQRPPAEAGYEAKTLNQRAIANTLKAILLPLLFWLLSAPLLLPATALFTHYLGPTQFGWINATVPILSLGALFSCTGMDPAVIRSLSHRPRSEWGELIGEAAGARLCSTTLGVLIVLLLAWTLPLSEIERWLLSIGSFSLYFSYSFAGFRMITTYGYRAEQRVFVPVLMETGSRIALALVLVLTYYYNLPLILAFTLTLYIDIPFFLLQFYLARKTYQIKLRITPEALREHLLRTFSLTGYDALALIIAQADLFLLMVLSSPLQVGLYALALRITDPLYAFTIVCIDGLYPLFCACAHDVSKQLAPLFLELLRIMLLLLVPITLWISTQATSLVFELAGAPFAEAATLLVVLWWTTVLLLFNMLALRCCLALDREQPLLLIAIVTAVLNVVGNSLCIPSLASMGAGLVALGSEVVTLCWLCWLIRDVLKPTKIVLIGCRIVVANLPCLLYLLWRPHNNLWLSFPMILLLATLGSVIMGVLRPGDVKMLGRIIRKRTSDQHHWSRT